MHAAAPSPSTPTHQRELWVRVAASVLTGAPMVDVCRCWAGEEPVWRPDFTYLGEPVRLHAWEEATEPVRDAA